MSYAGKLDVEDDEFVLVAETFIVRDREVSFVFSGTDDESSFSISGVAKLTENGFYMAPRLLVNYKIYDGEFRASIKIVTVHESPGKRKCKVSGCWIEDGGDWAFTGNLQKKA